MLRGMPNRRRAGRGSILAFCLYDAGDSAFATTILAVLFNQYFAEQVAGGAAGTRILGVAVPGGTLYTWLVSATMLCVAAAAPILGAWTDASGRRMAALRILTVAGGLFTVALATVGPGDWIRGSLLFVASYGAFALASVLYNAFLPGLASKDEVGRVSGLAWGVGYIGGGAFLALNLAALANPGRFGLSGTQQALHARFAGAGIWWILLTLPLLLRREESVERPKIPWSEGVRRAKATLRRLRRTPHFLRFLIAFLLYNDAIQTIVATASIFAAAELGFAPRELALLFLAIQGTGFIGSLAAGQLADRWGHKPAILIQLAAFLLLTVWTRWVGIFGDARREFWVIGISAGAFLGGIQTVSRSLLARWVPERRSAEIYGFFSVAGRFASVLGPLVFGALVWISGGLRPAVLSVSAFFLAGGALLASVSERRGEVELDSEGEGPAEPSPREDW